MIGERDVVALLHDAGDAIDVPAPAAAVLARAGRRRVRQRRTGGVLAALAVTAAVAASLTVGNNDPLTSAVVSGASTGPLVSSGCTATVKPRLLPTWARAGFTDPRPRMPYLRSQDGNMVAILFGQPLTVPPAADHNNKILWVSHTPPDSSSALRIEAQLSGGTATVTREVPGGPGPSIIDLPRPGCWQFTLRWGQTVDTVSLRYVARQDEVAALRRPLVLPTLAPGSTCPVTRKRHRPDPTLGIVQGTGPVGPMGLSTKGVLSYVAPGPRTVWADRAWGGQKVVWAVDGAISGDVLVRGGQLDGRHELRFEDPATPELLLRPNVPSTPGGWRAYPGYTRLRAPGCYAYQVDTASGTSVFVFRAEGPAVS